MDKMHSRQIFTLLLLCFIILIGVAHQVARAEPFFQPGVGLRALGMGGAFVALADDMTAVYWNPAGLSQLHAFRFAASLPFPSSESLFSAQYYGASANIGILGISAILASKAYPRDPAHEIRHLLQLGAGAQISSSFRAGASFKHYTRDINQAQIQGFGIDLGAIIEPFSTGLLSHLTIGIKMADIGGVTLKGSNSAANNQIDMRFTLGAMLHWYNRRLRFVGDFEIVHKGVDGIHLGIEGVVYEAFAARLGWHNGEATWGVSFGINDLFRADFMTISNGFTIATELILFAQK